MMGLRNQVAGIAPGFFLLPLRRRRQRGAGGHLDLAAAPFDDGNY